MRKINVVPRPNFLYSSGSEVTFSADIPVEELATKIVDKNIKGEEEYELTVNVNEITMKANGEKGFFYALQTLKQLVFSCKDEGVLPCLVIRDEPHFEYRGFMIDCVRHMVTMSGLKKMIDAAALFKLNVFHWHLTNDQGWRIEINKYPKLIEIGSRRNGSDFGNTHTGGTYGGYYTKEQIKEIVEYCKERYITVIPEFDIPGHTIAAIASYPELSCSGEQVEVETHQGIFRNIMCAGNENTYKFIFDVLDEIIELFPSEYIHIGGDEAPKNRWKSCPKCQEKMAENGLNDEEELQGYFTNRIVEYLASKGKKAIAWNECLNSGLVDDSVTVQAWMDKTGSCVKWANKGNKVIVSDFYNYYVDYPYGMTPLSKTYKYNPIPLGVDPVMTRNIKGVEANLWTEHIRSFEEMTFMCYPRFAAVAETGWTYKFNKDYDDFEERIGIIIPMLWEIGLLPATINEWDPPLIERGYRTARFFYDTVSRDAIKNLIPLPFRKDSK